MNWLMSCYMLVKMGRKPVDYSKGKIYAILEKGVKLEDADGKVYIGSTAHYLAMRFGGHISEYVSGDAHCMSKELFEEYGVDNCEIILIEDYPCKTKRELNTREGQHQRTIKCVNKVIAGRTKEQYAVERRDFILQQKIVFYNTHKEAILAQQKEYTEKNREVVLARKRVYTAAHKTEKVAYDKIRREENKEEIAAAKKKYHEDNREKILEKNKVKYAARKDQMKERVVCECGISCAKHSMTLHRKSKKHAIAMEAIALQTTIPKSAITPNQQLKKKEKYEANKHKLKEQVVCECGTSCTIYALNKHRKSKKHATLMEALSLQEHQAHAPTLE